MENREASANMARRSNVGTFWNASLRDEVDGNDTGESASLYGDSDLFRTSYSVTNAYEVVLCNTVRGNPREIATSPQLGTPGAHR